jgi:hypothetical protein
LKPFFFRFIIFISLCASAIPLVADPIPVRHYQGTFHGFLTLKDPDNHIIAIGDIAQIGSGSRVTSHLTLRFRDGSLNDETAVFTQRKNFQLISDHLIQRGPSFPNQLDIRFDTASGNVTTISTKDGKSDTRQDHIDMPPDVYNGLTTLIMLNLDTAAPSTRIAFVAPGTKPRLVHLVITPEGDDRATVAGSPRTVTRYKVKFDLGTVANVVAPIVGKQPADMHIWIMPGPAPTLVQQETQLYEGGPIWRIEQAAPILSQPQKPGK